MNQTRILLGVILLLLAGFGFLWWNQEKQLESQREANEKLIAALQPGATSAATPAVKSAPVQAAAPAVANAGEVPATANPTKGPQAAEIDPVVAAKDAEIAALLEEREILKAKGQADVEEKQRLSGELERANFEIDLRKQRILGAPMLCKVSKVLPQHGFIVIASGRATGIEPGDAFSIRRGGKIICRITIGQSIDENEAVADVSPGSLPPNEQIQEGDDVVKLD